MTVGGGTCPFLTDVILWLHGPGLCGGDGIIDWDQPLFNHLAYR